MSSPETIETRKRSSSSIPTRKQQARTESVLRYMKRWRKSVAEILVTRNASINGSRINTITQELVHAVLFLRICEDRSIETSHQLIDVVNQRDVFQRLVTRIRDIEQKYQLILLSDWALQKEPETFPADYALAKALSELYPPHCPFSFSEVSADILGFVYEYCLAKPIIQALDSAQFTQSKKNAGIYYTPSYIAEYIINESLNPILSGTTGHELDGIVFQDSTSNPQKCLSILDPSCGSGNFLIVAYQKLLDWHLNYYRDNYNPKNHHCLRRVRQDGWKLTLQEKFRIFLNNIFGLDLDHHAVEVAKSSLLLKILEDETEETLTNQIRQFEKRKLPSLSDNIKCGNALVTNDDFEIKKELGSDIRNRLRPFNWDLEFPHIKIHSGFDVIVGNPPYRRERDYKGLVGEIAQFDFGKKYSAPRMDLWYYFVHRGLKLLKANGSLSFIVNSYWLNSSGAQKLIHSIQHEAHLETVFLLGKNRIFKNVSGHHMLFRITKGAKEKPIIVKDARGQKAYSSLDIVQGRVPIHVYQKTKAQVFRSGEIDLNLPSSVLDKLDNYPTLGDYSQTRQGIAENPASINRSTNTRFGEPWTVGEGVFALTEEEMTTLQLSETERALIKPYFHLRDIDRFYLSSKPSLNLIYSTRKTCPDITVYPKLEEHLNRFRVVMEGRRETKKGLISWWHLHWPRNEELWQKPKILSVQMGVRPKFTVALKPSYVNFSVNVIVPHDNSKESLIYLTALLNSRLLWYWFIHHGKKRGIGIEINGKVLSKAPILIPDDKTSHKFKLKAAIVTKAKERMVFEAEIREGCTHGETKQRIQTLEDQLDALVYEVYGLTVEETKLVKTLTANSITTEGFSRD